MTERPTVFVSLHVPKCAGTSIESHMKEHLAPETVWITRKRWRSLPPMAPPFYAPRRDDVNAVRFVGGHYIGKSIEAHFAEHFVKRSVLLREPLSFHLSYYNYRSMRYLSQGLQTYSFDDHVKSQSDDPISHFLLKRWLEIPHAKLLAMPVQQKFDLLNESLSKFWFVGDLSCCNELVAAMSEDLGISANLAAKNTKDQWQRRGQWKLLTKEALTPAQVELVAQRTQLDLALWQTWKIARFNAASTVQVPLPAGAGKCLVRHELRRPYQSLVRRLKRGWN